MLRVASFVFFALLVCTAPAAHARTPEGVPIGKGKTAPTVTLVAPTGGWTVDRMILISGTVSDQTIDPVVLSINGDRYLLRTRNGRFWRKFPAATGKNIVTVLATNLGGTTTAQATTFVQAPPVPLKVVLTSDTDGVYTDLHIYEPPPKAGDTLTLSEMPHVYWADTSSPTGGTFFLNEQGGSADGEGDFDQPGYGPYLYIHRAPPKGVFCIATNYWPSGDKAHTLAILNLALFEGTPNEIKRTVRVPLATPGVTRVLVWVNVVDGSHATVYVPGQDRVPTGGGWPKNLAEIADKVQKSSSGEY